MSDTLATKLQLKPLGNKHMLHSELCNHFCIRESLHQYLANYYLLYWNGHYCISQIKEGTIEREGIKYLVIYYSGTSRGKILANEKSEVALSFRRAKEEFDLPAYVLVSLCE